MSTLGARRSCHRPNWPAIEGTRGGKRCGATRATFWRWRRPPMVAGATMTAMAGGRACRSSSTGRYRGEERARRGALEAAAHRERRGRVSGAEGDRRRRERRRPAADREASIGAIRGFPACADQWRRTTASGRTSWRTRRRGRGNAGERRRRRRILAA